jgi:hypothetical protein
MRRLSCVLAIFAVSAGCSGRDVTRDAGDSTRSLVRVDLSYTHTAGAPAGDARFDAQAHFVRYRAFDTSSVPTLLGFADYDAIPIESCRGLDGTAALDEALGTEAAGVTEVALLDAGRIDVRGPIDRAALRSVHYPELVPFVSGIVYGGDDAHPISLGLGQSYAVLGDGGEEVGPFTAGVVAPRSFPGLIVDSLRRGSDLDVRWTPAEESGEALLLEVKWSSRAGSRSVRCRVRDDGEFSVAHDAFDLLPASLGSSDGAPPRSPGTVTLSRIARAQLVAQGAGRGELTVELRDVAPLQVAP